MRTQGQARFTGQDFWHARVGAASMVNDAIDQEAVLEGTQEKPHYSPVVNMVIGAVILVCMLTGVYLAVRYGY